jgi:hypothetical protein
MYFKNYKNFKARAIYEQHPVLRAQDHNWEVHNTTLCAVTMTMGQFHSAKPHG